MSLSFPNRSRSYDPSGRRIRFIGHDGMFEVSFFVAADVFPAATTEAGYLAAFDKARDAVETVARKAYGRKNTYLLTPADFPKL
jgi:hypothetical protein